MTERWEVEVEEREEPGGDTVASEIAADKHQLNLNIASIVIGALVVLSLLAWINVIRSWCEHVIEDDRKDRYHCIYRKIMVAVVITLITIFISLGVCFWYRG